MSYTANETRYAAMQYRRCGNSGVMLPILSLGLWHNFGAITPFETQQAMLRAAFDHGNTAEFWRQFLADEHVITRE